MQYLGSRAPEPVKKKVLEVMFSWTLGLPEETKIADAYQMLKKQGGSSGRCRTHNLDVEMYNFPLAEVNITLDVSIVTDSNPLRSQIHCEIINATSANSRV